MLITLLKFVIDPFNIFWILLSVSVGMWLLRKDRLAKVLVISAGVWFLLISTPLLPNAIVNSLEDRYEPVNIEEFTNLEAEYHILILGGGHGFDDRLPANALLSQNALGRLNEGIRLYRRLPNSKLVLSGFSSSGRTTQAEMLQQAAFLLGVNEDETLLQSKPANTYEEAEVYTKTHGNMHPLILVTSAVHMPRAVKTFRTFGIDPIPSPTNYRLKGSWKQKWLGFPAMDNIENIRAGINEYAGILWYSLSS